MTPGDVEFLTLERSALPCGLGLTQKVLKASTTASQLSAFGHLYAETNSILEAARHRVIEACLARLGTAVV